MNRQTTSDAPTTRNTGHPLASVDAVLQKPQAPAVHLAHSAKPVIPRDRLLRLPDVCMATGCSKSTVYSLMKEGKFPASIRITARMAGWPESAVLQWVQDRINQAAGVQ